MVIFKARDIGNQPEVTITGSSIEHVLSSRYFHSYTYYTYDGKFEVIVEGQHVKIKSTNPKDPLSGMVIGYMIVDE